MSMQQAKPIILVVDDDFHLRKFVTTNLEARGYEVIQASDGLEAVSVLDDEKVDLIVLDINMPGLDGFGVCKIARELGDTPILMLSAMQDLTDRAKCLALGADDYMNKPFSLREFLTRVQEVVRRDNQAGRLQTVTRN
jgi:DNA-binding response OmpR family regulator